MAVGYPITDDLHTCDAYYSSVVLKSDLLVIPYINVGISRHPLNPEAHLAFIDFAYVVCRGIHFLNVASGVETEPSLRGPL